MDDQVRDDTPPSDELLPKVAAGDARAFTALFRRRRSQVYRFALHMTGSAPLAEDVTQEVFLAVMREAGRYEPGRSSEIAWLCGIARNHVRRRLDQEQRVVALDDADPGSRADGAVQPGDALSELLRVERVEAVRRAVFSLPLRYREVIVLCDLEEMSYVDAASAIGCAIGTVRSRLSRARELLASKLGVSDAVDERQVGMVTRERVRARCTT